MRRCRVVALRCPLVAKEERLPVIFAFMKQIWTLIYLLKVNISWQKLHMSPPASWLPFLWSKWAICWNEKSTSVLHTHSHSSVCQLPAHIQDHRHICSCPACSGSAVCSDHCQAWSTHPPLKEKLQDFCTNQTWTKHFSHCLQLKILLTFKKAGWKPGFADWSIWHKLEPELVGAAFDVAWFVVATETAEQRAVLRTAVPHFHIVIGTAVMSLNLQARCENDNR